MEPRPVSRRSVVAALAAAPLVSRLAQRPDRLVIDAMGELRFDYPAALIRDMLSSGMDAITVTLCDPKPEGPEALSLAVDSLL